MTSFLDRTRTKTVLVRALAIAAIFTLVTGVIVAIGMGGENQNWGTSVMNMVSLIAMAYVLFIGFRLRNGRKAVDKLSSDMDVMSQRLIQLESRIADFDAQAGKGLRHNVSELTAEIGLLGGLVKDLAVAVASHESDLTGLKDKSQTPQENKQQSIPADVKKDEDKKGEASKPQDVLYQTPVLIADRRDKIINDQPLPVDASFEEVREETHNNSVTSSEQNASHEEQKRLETREEEIVQALKEDSIELYLQPIVALPQRRPKLYEVLARLKIGDDRLVPAEFMPVLERRNLVTALDKQVLARGAAIARHLSSRGSDALIMCNMNPSSLAQPDFGRSLLRLVEAYPELAQRIVLEASQRIWRKPGLEVAQLLTALKAKGVSFSLDKAHDWRFDPITLADRGVKFIKLPTELLLNAETRKNQDIDLSDFSSLLARAGIQLIAEKVETEVQVVELLDLNVPLAQGYLFSPPRAVRTDVVSKVTPQQQAPQKQIQESGQTPEEPPPETESVESVTPATQRMPLRAFLRRASA